MTYRQLGNCTYNFEIPPPIQIRPASIQVNVEEKEVEQLSNPETWGPAMWFVNHLGSVSAPEVVPPEKREKYWNYIDGLPEMLPCQKCAGHAREFVDQHAPHKEHICASRENLVKFFVDFHNSVNDRSGKPQLTYDEVYQMFSGPAVIKHFSYKN